MVTKHVNKSYRYLSGGVVDPKNRWAMDADAYNWMRSFPESDPYPGAKPLSRDEINEIKRQPSRSASGYKRK